MARAERAEGAPRCTLQPWATALGHGGQQVCALTGVQGPLCGQALYELAGPGQPEHLDNPQQQVIRAIMLEDSPCSPYALHDGLEHLDDPQQPDHRAVGRVPDPLHQHVPLQRHERVGYSTPARPCQSTCDPPRAALRTATPSALRLPGRFGGGGGGERAAAERAVT